MIYTVISILIPILCFLNIVGIFYLNKIYNTKCQEVGNLRNKNMRLENKIEFLKARVREKIARIYELEQLAQNYSDLEHIEK